MAYVYSKIHSYIKIKGKYWKIYSIRFANFKPIIITNLIVYK